MSLSHPEGPSLGPEKAATINFAATAGEVAITSLSIVLAMRTREVWFATPGVVTAHMIPFTWKRAWQSLDRNRDRQALD